MYEGDVVGL